MLVPDDVPRPYVASQCEERKRLCLLGSRFQRAAPLRQGVTPRHVEVGCLIVERTRQGVLNSNGVVSLIRACGRLTVTVTAES